MLDAIASKVVHVHAKDISTKQAEEERGKVTGTAVGCACGEGVIDWHRVVRQLKQSGFTGASSPSNAERRSKPHRFLSHLNKVLSELGA